jgi:ubiquinone/menaquinone biosynthesis C-methylase UbiE
MEQEKKNEFKYYDGENFSDKEREEKIKGWMEKAKIEMDNINFDVLSYYLSPYVDLTKELLSLDAGCGPGHVSYTFESRTPFKMVGMDLSSTVLTAANRYKKIKGYKTELAVGDLENNCFKDNSFDIVILVATIHHFPNFDTPLSSIYRILRPGGKLIIYDSNLLFPPVLWRSWKLKLKKQPWGTENEWPFTKFHLKKSLKRTGYKITSLSNIRYLPLSMVRNRLNVDKFISKIPIINLFGSVILCVAEK